MADRSPAQIYALVFGAVLTVAGIIGFFYSSAFGSPGETDDVFRIPSIVPVNTVDNVLHVLIGIAGIAAFAVTPPLRERVRLATT
jgi:hypothetical protein